MFTVLKGTVFIQTADDDIILYRGTMCTVIILSDPCNWSLFQFAISWGLYTLVPCTAVNSRFLLIIF